MGAQAAPAADRDGDKVFDALQATLGAAGPHAVIVALRRPATAGRVEDIEGDVGDLGPVRRLRLVDAFTAEATPAQIRALAARADVAHVEEDARVVPFGVSAQASFGLTKAREDLPGLTGEGRVAAVIDSGIDTTMPDLPASKVVAFADLVAGREAPYDDLGHGSLVAGALAGTGASGAEGRGAAPAAKLVGIKVIDGQAQSSLGRIAEGVQWAVEHRAQYGIDVINLSIGDPVGCGAGTDVASQAVDAAVAAGIVVVAAAGNAGPEPCTIKSPAAAAGAITVGAMSDLGAGGFANGWFSSRGPTLDGRTKPDVSAPGVNVVMATPWGTHEAQSGTSAAAPFVSGVALLMLQAAPNLAPAQVKAAMERTAVDFGRPGRDNAYGAGRLDAYAALRDVGAALTAPPAVPLQHAFTGTLAEGETAERVVEVTDPAFPLAATLDGPGAGFDLALLAPDGHPVGTGVTQLGGPSRQEDLSLLAPEPGCYTVRVTARAGAGAYVADVSAALDTAPPALTLDDPGTMGSVVLTGTAGTSLGDQGVLVDVLVDGTVARRVHGRLGDGRWSTALTLPDGTYSVEAEQRDCSGHVTRTPARTLIVDTKPVVTPTPTVIVTATPSPTATATATPTATPEPTVAPPPLPAPRVVPPRVVVSAPGLALTVAKQRLATVLQRGLAVRVSCSSGCRATVVVTRGRTVVARGSGATLKLTAAARRALAKARRVTLTVTASAPGAKPVTRSVTLSR